MASASDIERGQQPLSRRSLQWIRSVGHSSNIFRRLVRLISRDDGAATEPLIQANGRKAGNSAGFVTGRLTVEKVALLVDCDVDFLESLELQLSKLGDELSSEVEWNKDNIAKLISHCGRGAVNAPYPGGKSLLHESIICNAIDCAKQLFAYAANQGISVILQWGEEDILGWALKNEQKTTAAFVLGRIVDKCSTPSESARVIRKHFDALLKGIPRTMQKLIESDQFCFEYGRFQVPAEVFAMNAGASIHKRQDRDITTTHSTDMIPWNAANSDEVEDFWKRNNLGFTKELDRSSGTKVTAVSNFICINCPFHKEPRSVLSQLVSSGCSIEIFMSTTVKTLLQWKWRVSAMEKQLVLLAVHFFCGVLFLLYAAQFETAVIDREGNKNTDSSPTDGDSRDPTARLEKNWALVACAIVMWCALLFIYQPLLLLYAINVTYIFFRCLFSGSHSEDTAFLSSVQCIFILILITQALRPFKLTGPFISMVHYTILDIAPFLMLGAVTISTVGIALMVSFASTTIGCDEQNEGKNCTKSGDEDHEKDYDEFNTPVKAFETLFYAMLGTVEEDDFRSFSSNFLSIWRAILFDAFLILGAVVLLSLLIAVLGDTFDRVMCSREAEFVKCRAVAAEQGRFPAVYWVLSCARLLRCPGSRPWHWFDADLLWIKFKAYIFRGSKFQPEIERRQSQLLKLQRFEEQTHSIQSKQAQPSTQALIFHFLVPADANVGKKKKSSSWHGKVFVLVNAMESMFESTRKFLKVQSDSSNEALAKIEKQVEAACERVGNVERKLEGQSGSDQAQMRLLDSHFETLLRRIDAMEHVLKTISEKITIRESTSQPT